MQNKKRLKSRGRVIAEIRKRNELKSESRKYLKPKKSKVVEAQ